MWHRTGRNAPGELDYARHCLDVGMQHAHFTLWGEASSACCMRDRTRHQCELNSSFKSVWVDRRCTLCLSLCNTYIAYSNCILAAPHRQSAKPRQHYLAD